MCGVMMNMMMMMMVSWHVGCAINLNCLKKGVGG